MASAIAFCQCVNQAAQCKEITWTEAQLLKYIGKLAQGRLGGCIARVRMLATAIGRSVRHTRRLISSLECKGWLKRQSRFLPGTNGRTSNLLSIPNRPLPTIKWQDTRPNNYVLSSIPIQQPHVYPSIQAIKNTLEGILSHAKSLQTKQVIQKMSEFYLAIKGSEVFIRFTKYYQQSKPKKAHIKNYDAYIAKCTRNVKKGYCRFWNEFLAYLAQIIKNQEESAPERQVSVDASLLSPEQIRQNIFDSISADIPLTLRKQMIAFYQKRFG